MLMFEGTNFSHKQVCELIDKSQSQLGQDFLALRLNKFKRNGFFVEFGATDGVYSSNTLLLEKEFGWNGILAEPARSWIDDLKRNRNCVISDDCVYKKDGEFLMFRESKSNPELSSLSNGKKENLYARKKSDTDIYEVKTISLRSLLSVNNAPKTIDFLSIDTEGTEFEVIESFDFSEYIFNLICIEHNHQTYRSSIRSLLEKNGYVQIFSYLSSYEDWYTPNHLADELRIIS